MIKKKTFKREVAGAILVHAAIVFDVVLGFLLVHDQWEIVRGMIAALLTMSFAFAAGAWGLDWVGKQKPGALDAEPPA